ncbi:PrsW family glutamic-type intramembrane protease [Actinoplanes sp. NPDC051494]|uniref:PrsW family glutamic-type intramembrane protease n=1 Tax=Actinoplanes sp. NPDC051494 TaxID=3363907 RepID=UPI0037BC8416
MADVAPGSAPAPEQHPTSGTPADQPAPASAGLGGAASGAGSEGLASLGFATVGGAHVVPMESGSALPVTTGRRAGWRRWLPLTGIIVFFAACSIAMLIILGSSNGPTGLVIGLTAAILPVPLLASAFLWLDRYEPEPFRYLAFSFAWGAVVATLVAIGVNTGTAKLFDSWGLPEALVAVLVAPFIEESMKALGPVLLFWRRRKEWSGITDGIVYCGLSALGFAMVENVLYLGGHGYAAGADQYGPATGVQNVFLIFIVRIVFTGFAHPLFTAMTGIGLGLASRSAARWVRWLAPLAGLLLAMILHGTFNLLPTISAATGQTIIMLYGYLGFMVPFFFAAVGFAIALRGYEGRLSERILPHYVRAGWLSPPEVATLGSLGRRNSARQWAKRVAGESGLRAMRGFQLASTQLALLRDGMQRGLRSDPQDLLRAQEEERKLLADISGFRAIFVGRDPQAPRAFWDGNAYQIAFPDGVTRTVGAPLEPVVPLPVRLPPQIPVYAGYGPTYAQQPAYAAHGQQPGYPTPYGQQPGYASPYGQQPAYGPGQPPYGQSYAQPPHGQQVYGQPSYAQPPGQPSNGQNAHGQTSYGPPSYGPPSYGPPSYGPPFYGQQSYGQPGYGQPGYGQAQVQPSYGQPAYGQAQGQPAYGQPQGQPAHGQSGGQVPGPQPDQQAGHGTASPGNQTGNRTSGRPEGQTDGQTEGQAGGESPW